MSISIVSLISLLTAVSAFAVIMALRISRERPLRLAPVTGGQAEAVIMTERAQTLARPWRERLVWP